MHVTFRLEGSVWSDKRLWVTSLIPLGSSDCTGQEAFPRVNKVLLARSSMFLMIQVDREKGWVQVSMIYVTLGNINNVVLPYNNSKTYSATLICVFAFFMTTFYGDVIVSLFPLVFLAVFSMLHFIKYYILMYVVGLISRFQWAISQQVLSKWRPLLPLHPVPRDLLYIHGIHSF